jgi:hypothetical protein
MSATVELVPNAALRERFLALRERGETSYALVAVRCGWWTLSGEPNRAKVAQCLGVLNGARPSRPNRRLQVATGYENALKLADALGLDPREAGL